MRRNCGLREAFSVEWRMHCTESRIESFIYLFCNNTVVEAFSMASHISP